MKRTIFLTALALLISAGITAQSTGQNQVQNGNQTDSVQNGTRIRLRYRTAPRIRLRYRMVPRISHRYRMVPRIRLRHRKVPRISPRYRTAPRIRHNHKLVIRASFRLTKGISCVNMIRLEVAIRSAKGIRPGYMILL